MNESQKDTSYQQRKSSTSQIHAQNYEKINHALEDPEKFLGQFPFNNHIITRAYLPGEGTQLRLYYTKVSPTTTIRASICMIHGFGEHSGRFLHIADYFANKGFEIHLIDLRGFGYSGGARGCATQAQILLDVKVLIQQVNPHLPLFLYGHSMGGLIVLSFTLLNPTIQIAGVIATSPLLGFPSDRKLDYFKLKFVTSAGKKLEDMVINSMVNPTALTKNNNQLRHSFGDRLMIPFCGLNMAASILDRVRLMKKMVKQFNKPVFILHGKQDAVTNYQDSVYFFENCASQDKSIKIFEHGYHELQHDEECDELLNITLDWLQRKLETAQALNNVPHHIHVGEQKVKTKKRYKFVILLIIILYILYSWRFSYLAGTSKWKKLIIPFLLLVKRQ